MIVSCTPKTNEREIAQTANIEIKKPVSQIKEKPKLFDKTLRESVYFASSLEREALKLIFKNRYLQKQTLFSVLSYIVEINTGAKKSVPYGLDCGKFDVKREGNTIHIFKSCIKPIVEIAKIHILSEDRLYDVQFMIREWANVVGLSVSLTGSDVLCQIAVKNHKLNRLNCDNWSYQTGQDQTSSTVVRAKQFLFEREAQKQFVIKGGFFKELVENKKIDIMVPLEGKIKIIEKELKVIDEFAERIKRESGKKDEKSQIKNQGVSEEGVKENSQESPQEKGQQINPQDYQNGQEPGQENPQPEEVPSGRSGR